MGRIILNLPLLGNVLIDFIDKNLFEFTKRQFRNYIVSVFDKSINEKYFILIKSNEINNIKFDNIILGRNIKFKDNKLQIVKNSRVKKLHYEYDFNDNLKLYIRLRKNFLFYLKNFLNSSYSINHGLFYDVVLFPIFSLYTLKDNYFLVHGSLIKINEKYIVLTGLDGVGKSSLAAELVLQGAKILADNFVLFNGEKFFGLNMPIRLDLKNDINKNVIFKNNNLKEVLFESYENKPVLVNKIYFLYIGEKLSIKNINKDIVIYNWNLINNGAKEIFNANLFCLPFLYQNIFFKEIKSNEIEYYSFSIPKNKIKSGVKELLCHLNI